MLRARADEVIELATIFGAAHGCGYGAKLPIRNLRFSAAFGSKADVLQTSRNRRS